MINTKRSVPGRRRRISRRKKGIAAFLQRNAILAGIIMLVLIAGVICLLLFTGEKKETVAQTSSDTTGLTPTPTAIVTTTPVPSATESAGEGEGEGGTESPGPDILIDPSLIDEGMVSDAGDIYLVESDVKIGITIGAVRTENDRRLLTDLEKTSGEAEKAGEVYKVFFYDAGGSYNQQLQDIRNLIQNEVDVIIVGATDEETFSMIAGMAEQAGIPVVTYESAASEGYAVNVVTDWISWGEKYGSFMAQNLSEGAAARILGSDTDPSDIVAKSAIESKLFGNTGITDLGAVYASWNPETAGEAMNTLLEQNTVVDGIITEEGMARAILDSYIESGKLPKTMCGDTTAAFIRKWYALKNGGVVIIPAAQGKKTPPAYMLTAQPDELIVCAQPIPCRAASIAFEVAVRLGEGRELIEQGTTYIYKVQTFITEENLNDYYDIIKEMPDTYVIGDGIDLDQVESLFVAE